MALSKQNKTKVKKVIKGLSKASKTHAGQAKTLMSEAGYGEGFKLTIHGPAGRYANDTRILEAIAQMLSSIGIETSVETMPASVFFKRFAVINNGNL